MRQSAIRIYNFFRYHKYGKWTLLGVLLLVAGTAALLLRTPPQDKVVPLTDVAAAISAGRVMRIEDAQDTGTLTIHYTDGTEQTARRDKSASFFEQMGYLGITNAQLERLNYEIVEPRIP